ncbi:MAG: hypothetical protein B6D47_11970 [Rhodocyclaceae bacterium UTPRO2]|nr:MAG: hypothetical protein B6D47_11970 [Rhodocyclaceae bacterium UTPRO2]
MAGSTAARTGDAETGLRPIFDREKVQKEIEAQAAITQVFGQQASRAVGDFAQKKMEEAKALRARAEREPDASLSNALNAQADELDSQWGERGTLRLAAHTLIGGLTGGVSGAAGAAAGTLTAPLVAEALRDAGIDGPLATTLTALASTAVGAAVGGAPGAGAALNEVGNNYLNHTEAANLVAARKRQRECTDDACRREAQGAIDYYTKLSAVRDDTLRAACAQDSAGFDCQYQIALAREAALSYRGLGIPRQSELGEYAAQAARMADTPHYQPEAMRLLALRIGMPVAMLAAGTAAVTASQIVGYCAVNPAACNAAGVEIGNIIAGDALPIGVGAVTAGKVVANSAVPAGAHLIGAGDRLAEAAAWVKPQQGVFDVIVHGSEDAFHVLQNERWIELDQRALATFIQKNGHAGEPIRLISCSTGACSKGAAQNLANKLGTRVIAPSDTVWIHPNGSLTIGNSATTNTGTWNTFTPGKR